jgi:hypothetical protein
MPGINLRGASRGVNTKTDSDKIDLADKPTDVEAEVKVSKETLELAKTLDSNIVVGCDGNCEACKKCVTQLINQTNSEELEKLLNDPKKLEYLSNYIGQENLEDILVKLQSGDELAMKEATDKFLTSMDTAFKESKDEPLNKESIDTANQPVKNLDADREPQKQQITENTITPLTQGQDVKLNLEQVGSPLNENTKTNEPVINLDPDKDTPKLQITENTITPPSQGQDVKLNPDQVSSSSNTSKTNDVQPSITTPQQNINTASVDIPTIKNQINDTTPNQNIVSTVNSNQVTQEPTLSKQITVEIIKQPLTKNTANVNEQILAKTVKPATHHILELTKPKQNIQVRSSPVQTVTKTPVRDVVNALKNLIKTTEVATNVLQLSQREVLQKALSEFQTKDLVKTLNSINERLANKTNEPVSEKLKLFKEILSVEINQRKTSKQEITKTSVQNRLPVEERFIRLASTPQAFEKALNRVIERSIPKPEIIRQVTTELKANLKELSSMVAALRLAQKTAFVMDPKLTQRITEVLKTSQTTATALELSKNRIQTVLKIIDKNVQNLESSIKKHIPKIPQDLIRSRNLPAIIAQLNALVVNNTTPELVKLLAHLQNLESHRISLKASSDALEEALEEYYETKRNLDIQMLLRAGVNISLDSVGNKKRRSLALNKNQLEQVKTQSVSRGVIQQSSSALDGATSAKANKNAANSQVKDRRSPTAELLTFLGMVDDSNSRDGPI